MSGDTQDNKGKDEGGSETTFTQEKVNKLVGDARIKARELAKAEFEQVTKDAATEAEEAKLTVEKEYKKLADMHSARVKELEPLEAEVKGYRELIAGMLKDRVKELGDAAKKAVDTLPGTPTDLEKLKWLNDNQARYVTEDDDSKKKVLGSPAKKVKKKAGTKESEDTVLGKGRKFRG